MLNRLTQGTVTFLIIVYAAVMVAWLIARLVMGESSTWVGYGNAGGLWWFVPLLVFLPVALLVKSREATFIGLMLLLPFLWFYGADFTPNLPRTVASTEIPVRVLSFNTFVYNQNYEAVVTFIDETDADIVAIQELSHEMEAAITGALGAEYPYRLTYPWGDPRGIGIWSRYPMQEADVRGLDMWENWMQSAVVDVNGKPLRLINVHLWPIGTFERQDFRAGLRLQQQQSEELVTVVTQSAAPVLVVGDLNAQPTNDSYRRLMRVMTDSWSEVGWGPGFTFPAPNVMRRGIPPVLRIDYQLSYGAIEPVAIEILEPTGSDHLPVLADFVLK